MNELIQNAVLLSSPLLSLGALRFFPKHHWKIPLVVTLAIISLILPIGLGICSIGELPLLFQYTGHFQDGLIVILVTFLWAQIFINGGIGVWVSSKWNLLFESMCMGIIPLLLSRQNSNDIEDNPKIKYTGRQRWMIILGLGVGVIGNPIATIYSHKAIVIFSLAVLALLFAYCINFPEQDTISVENSAKTPYQYVNLAVFSLVSVIILVLPSQTYSALLLANILLLPISLRNLFQMESSLRKPPIDIFLWYVSIVTMTQISIIGGSSELLSWGVEEIQFNYGMWFPLAVLLLGITLGTLFDAVVVILLGSSLFVNALDLVEHSQDISVYVMIGCLIAFGVNAYLINFSRDVSKRTAS